jgi:hypothetical protein
MGTNINIVEIDSDMEVEMEIARQVTVKVSAVKSSNG